MKCLVIAGEASADRYGGALLQAIQQEHPGCTAFGIGGTHIHRHVSYFIYNSCHQSRIGVSGLWQKWTSYRPMYRALRQFLETQVIDFAVIIDFQHHNVALARLLQDFNIPIYTFITPNFWLYGHQKQAKKIIAYSQKIFTIFEKEYDFYKTMTPNVYYFGHPLLHFLSKRKPVSPFKSDGLKLGLLPGSRPQEFTLYLEKMLQLVHGVLETYPSLQVCMLVSHSRFKEKLISAIQNQGLEHKITLWSGGAEGVLYHSDALCCASGSSTLEAVLYKKPLVVLAGLPPITYFIAKHLLRIDMPFVSLPNIVAGKQVVPEFVQSDMDVPTMLHTLLDLLKNPQHAISNYDDVITHLRCGENDPFTCIAKELIIPSTS